MLLESTKAIFNVSSIPEQVKEMLMAIIERYKEEVIDVMHDSDFLKEAGVDSFFDLNMVDAKWVILEECKKDMRKNHPGLPRVLINDVIIPCIANELELVEFRD